MKIEISFPGQSVQTVDALPNVIQHYIVKDYDLPFVRLVSTIKPATLWSRLMKDKDGIEFWDYNHLEDGHCSDDVPTPKDPVHKQVWNGKWKKEFVHLINDGWQGSNKVYHEIE